MTGHGWCPAGDCRWGQRCKRASAGPQFGGPRAKAVRQGRRARHCRAPRHARPYAYPAPRSHVPLRLLQLLHRPRPPPPRPGRGRDVGAPRPVPQHRSGAGRCRQPGRGCRACCEHAAAGRSAAQRAVWAGAQPSAGGNAQEARINACKGLAQKASGRARSFKGFFPEQLLLHSTARAWRWGQRRGAMCKAQRELNLQKRSYGRVRARSRDLRPAPRPRAPMAGRIGLQALLFAAVLVAHASGRELLDTCDSQAFSPLRPVRSPTGWRATRFGLPGRAADLALPACAEQVRVEGVGRGVGRRGRPGAGEALPLPRQGSDRGPVRRQRRCE